MSEIITDSRVTTIFAADAVGYSRAMSRNEVRAIRALSASRVIFFSEIENRGGRVFSTGGDSVLAEFPAAEIAVETAVSIQQRLRREADTKELLTYRIGIHHGTVYPQDSDLLGDAVNIAARLESIAYPGGICMSGQVLDAANGKLDAHLVEMGPQLLKNILEPVRVLRCRAGEPEPQPEHATPSTTALVGVLPFEVASTDTEAYLADGLAEDLVIGLSRFTNLAVLGPGGAPRRDSRQPAGQAGAAYLVKGSVRRLAGSIRVDVQLIEGGSGRTLWAERFASPMTELFDFQDQVVARVVATVAGRIEDAGIAATRRARPDSVEAFDQFLQGLYYANRSDKASNALALEHLRAAVTQDRDYALAWAWLALMQLRQWSWQSRSIDLLATRQTADHARSLDPSESWCHLVSGQIAMYAREFDAAEVHHKKAHSLNPYSTNIMALRSTLATYLGKPEEGIEWATRAMQLYDAYPSWYSSNLGLAHYVARDYRSAVESYACIADPNVGVLAGLAASLAKLGDAAGAARVVDRIRGLEPEFSPERFLSMRPFRVDDDRQNLLDGLQLAGLGDSSPKVA